MAKKIAYMFFASAVFCLLLVSCRNANSGKDSVTDVTANENGSGDKIDITNKKYIKYIFDVTGSMKGYDDVADSLYRHTLTFVFDETLNFLDGNEYFWFGESIPSVMIGVNKFEDKLHAKEVMLGYDPSKDDPSGGRSIYITRNQLREKDSQRNTNILLPDLSNDEEMNLPFNLLTKYVNSQWEKGDGSLWVISTDVQEQGNDYSCFQELFKFANRNGKSFAFFLITSDYDGCIYNIYPGDIAAYYPLDMYNRNNYDKETGYITPKKGNNGGDVVVKYSGKKLFSIMVFGEKEDVERFYNLFNGIMKDINKDPVKNPVGCELFLYDVGVTMGNLNMFHLENYNNTTRYNAKKPDEYAKDFNSKPNESIGVGSANNYLRSAANSFDKYYPIQVKDEMVDLKEKIPVVEQKLYYVINNQVPVSRYVFAMPINYSKIGLKSSRVVLQYKLNEISAEITQSKTPAKLKKLADEKIEKNMIKESGIKILHPRDFIALKNPKHATHEKHVEKQDYFYFSVELSNEDFAKYKEECGYRLKIEFGNVYEEPPKSSLKTLVEDYNADYPREILNDAADKVAIMRTMNLTKIYSYIAEEHKKSLKSSFEVELFFLKRKG